MSDSDHVRPMSHANWEEVEPADIPERLRALLQDEGTQVVEAPLALSPFIRWRRCFKKMIEREESQLRALVPEMEPRLPIETVKEWLERFDQVLTQVILKRYT